MRAAPSQRKKRYTELHKGTQLIHFYAFTYACLVTSSYACNEQEDFYDSTGIKVDEICVIFRIALQYLKTEENWTMENTFTCVK